MIGGSVLKTSEGTKIEDKNISELPGFQRREGEAEVLARLFESKSSTLLYTSGHTIHVVNPISHSTTSLRVNDEMRDADIASGDFRLNGLQEVVIASRFGVSIVSALDPKDFSRVLYRPAYET